MTVLALLTSVALVLFVCSLLFGAVNYSFREVWEVITGHPNAEASFMVGQLRLPRAIVGALAGMSFGMAGTTFQTMLRNPLASPDVIGISAGSSAAAAVGIVFLGLSGLPLKLLAVICGLIVAIAVYVMGGNDKSASTKVILIGIGMAAIAESVTTFALEKAPQWDLQQAMRWLTGSLNGTNYGDVIWLSAAFIICAPILVMQMRSLNILQLGDETAVALGTKVKLTRFTITVVAITLIGFTTAVTGPIAFVAFLSGPIASRLINDGHPALIPAAITGSVLVLGADFLSQVILPTHYPVGVITGILGAPYLIYLIARTNKGQ